MAPKRGNPAFRRKIGARIRQLRAESGRTQESVAWACGIAKAMLSRIESGENLPSVPTLVLIAKELGVHPASILAFDMRDARVRLLEAARKKDARAALAALDQLGVVATETDQSQPAQPRKRRRPR